MKILNLILILMGLLVLTGSGCGESSPSTTQNPPQDAPEPTQTTQTPTPTADQKILSALEGYYADLGKEQLDEATYFAPVVQQFFASTDLPREQVGKSLRSTFTAVKERNIQVDPSSLRVTETNNGYIAEFGGNASFLRVKDQQQVSEPFRNRVHFNKEFLITRYQSLQAQTSRTETTRSISDQSPVATALSIANVVLPEFKSGKYKITPNYIHPQLGFYMVTQPGAYSVPYRLDKIGDMFKHAPWLKKGMEIREVKAKQEALPNFSCEGDDLFDKHGCFVEEVPNYAGVSNLMKALIEAEFDMFNDATIAEARLNEQLVKVALVETHSGLALYFGESKGKWYLLIVDMASFDCSA